MKKLFALMIAFSLILCVGSSPPRPKIDLKEKAKTEILQGLMATLPQSQELNLRQETVQLTRRERRQILFSIVKPKPFHIYLSPKGRQKYRDNFQA